MLDMSLKEDNVDAVEWATSLFPGAHLNEKFGKRYKFHLPNTGKKLSEIFSLLNDGDSAVSSFVLSQPTLEHVFLAVAKEARREEEEEISAYNNDLLF